MAKKQSGLEGALARTIAFIKRLEGRARELQSRIDRKQAKNPQEEAPATEEAREPIS